MQIDKSLTPAAVLALGIALAGLLVGGGFARARTADRFVEVKGVSEKVAKADLALWPLRLVTSGNDLADVQSALARNTATTYAFLRRHGVDTSGVEIQGVQVLDMQARAFGDGRMGGPRYIVSHTLMVRTTDVDRIVEASGRVGELIAAGVVLTSGRDEYSASGPTYLFTRLNDLKPEMIREATASARQAAEQFANDSRSALGGIRQASQGIFVILPRDQAMGISEESQPMKTVRVVSTIQYVLKN